MENFQFMRNLWKILPEIPSGAGSFLGLSGESHIQSQLSMMDGRYNIK
jgi:hypothetical protein